VIVLLNGEIYNFRELRDELKQKGCVFKTDSDTEVLVHLYQQQPDKPAGWLNRLNGIFAIALWDERRQKLLLARDHYGVKPLHIAQQGKRLLFGSEIKSLLAAGLKARLNRSALHVFLNIRYVPGEDTLFDDVRRFPPAHFAWVENGRFQGLERFYGLPSRDWKTDRNGLEEDIRERFHAAVHRQLISDVPVGMALSGGLDSSMIVASADQALKENRNLRTADQVLRTFTLGFNEPTDENEDAKVVADHYQTQHFDTRLDANPLEAAEAVIRAVEEPKINMLQGYELARFVQLMSKLFLQKE
ncbi:MAG: asparagine synthase-related protein, partial [Verrucomicrobiota bacterium]